MLTKPLITLAALTFCAAANAQDILKLGWPERGAVDPHSPEYLLYKGMAKVSGTVQRKWLVNHMYLDEQDGSLEFLPDAPSRAKYRMLPEVVDLAPLKDASEKVGLPFQLPIDTSVCGYEMQATLLLGDLYRFNISHSSGEDFSTVLAALEKEPTKEIFCTPDDERIDPLKPVSSY